MYGKLIDGVLIEAPKILKDEHGKVHYHPSEDMYKKHGFLPIVDTPPDVDEENPKYYTESWEERYGYIRKVYTETSAPKPIAYKPTLEDRLINLELAITNAEVALCEIYEKTEIKYG